MERQCSFAVIFAAVIALVMFGVVLLGPARRGAEDDPKAEKIARHLREMKRARKAMIGEQVTGPVGLTGHQIVKAEEQKYEYHRQQLVDIGYYFHRDFKFNQLPEPMHGRLWRRTLRKFPGNDHITLSWPDNVLSVWDRREKLKEWEEFHQQNNVANFK